MVEVAAQYNRAAPCRRTLTYAEPGGASDIDLDFFSRHVRRPATIGMH